MPCPLAIPVVFTINNLCPLQFLNQYPISQEGPQQHLYLILIVVAIITKICISVNNLTHAWSHDGGGHSKPLILYCFPTLICTKRESSLLPSCSNFFVKNISQKHICNSKNFSLETAFRKRNMKTLIMLKCIVWFLFQLRELSYILVSIQLQEK